MFDFKGFIGALLRPKLDNPVGNLKSATIWVQELPESDIHQAQAEIVKTLANLNENKRTSLKERFRVVMYLDEKARSLQRTLCREYLVNAENPEAAEKRFLPTILAFWEEMATAYQICIRQFADNPNNKLWPLVPHVTARAIHNYAMQAKWSYLRYMPVESTVWRNLHRLFLFSERESFDKNPLKLYPEDSEESSCLNEYMQAMMLHLASPHSLKLNQIEMLDGWLDSLSKSLSLEHEFRPHRQLYAVNLGDMKPGRKLRRNMLGEKYRYWGVGLLNVNIEKTIEQLKGGEVPARLKLSEECRLPECLELIELVKNRWTGKDTTRKHERKDSIKVVQVVQGFRNVMAQLKPRKGRKTASSPLDGQTIGQMVDYQISPNTIGGTPRFQREDTELFTPTLDQWVMENESVSGCGATFNGNGGPHLKIGSLIGLKPDSNKHFMIGVIRRINKNPESKVYVGIQTLCQTPIPVELQLASTDPKRAHKTDAIYLLENQDAQIPRSLLMSKDGFETGKRVLLKAQGKAYTIRLQQLLEHSEEYARASFDVLAKH